MKAPSSSSKAATPTLVSGLSKIIEIACGSDHCFAIDEQCEVFAWGYNNNSQLGIAQQDIVSLSQRASSTDLAADHRVKFPVHLRSLQGKSIDRISSGLNHSFAWSTLTGEVYCWGSSDNGKLGFSDSKVRLTSEPCIFESFVEASEIGWSIVEISCGESHTMAVINQKQQEEGSEEQKLFIWGCSNDWQLGIEISSKSDAINAPIQMNPDYWNGTIAQVHAGTNFSMGVDQQGNVFSWGCGEFNKLGFETDVTHQKVPRQIIGFHGEKVVTVSLGSFHSAAITVTGKLFTWGRDASGQLGHGKNQSETDPRFVEAFKDKLIIGIACGESHTVALTSQSEVYAWGMNKSKQLGTSDVLKSVLPRKLAYFDSIPIVKIASGRKHSLCLTRDGQVFAWGSNEFGQLGITSQPPSSSSSLTNSQLMRVPKIDISQEISENNSGILFSSQQQALHFHQHTNSDVNNNEQMLQQSLLQQQQQQQQDQGTFIYTPHGYHHPIIHQSPTISQPTTTPEQQRYSAQQSKQQKRSESALLASGSSRVTVEELQLQIHQLQQENALLRNRVLSLERSTDLDALLESDEKVFSLTNLAFTLLMETSLFSDTIQFQQQQQLVHQAATATIEQEIFQKNQHIDQIFEEFRKRLDASKTSEYRSAANFCDSLLHKLSRFLKRVNLSKADLQPSASPSHLARNNSNSHHNINNNSSNINSIYHQQQQQHLHHYPQAVFTQQKFVPKPSSQSIDQQSHANFQFPHAAVAVPAQSSPNLKQSLPPTQQQNTQGNIHTTDNPNSYSAKNKSQSQSQPQQLQQPQQQQQIFY